MASLLTMWTRLKNWWRELRRNTESREDDTMVRVTRFTKCYHCGSEHFDPGPRAGAAMHVYCNECGAGYNVFDLPYGVYLDKEIEPRV